MGPQYHSRYAILYRTLIPDKQIPNKTKSLELPIVYGRTTDDLEQLLEDETFTEAWLKKYSDELVIVKVH